MPSAAGVKRACAVSAPSSVTGGPSVWVHANDSGDGASSGSSDAEPSRRTASPIRPVWSGPASATGGWLTMVTTTESSLSSAPSLTTRRNA